MKSWVTYLFAGLILLACNERSSLDAVGNDHWFPKQKIPQSFVICDLDKSDVYNHFLAESLSGLAAQSVNNGEGTEMVWINWPTEDYTEWLERVVERLSLKKPTKTYTVWELVDRFHKMGVIKGYILYKGDQSKGHVYEYRPQMELSVNGATMLAGIHQAVLIEQSQEQKAKEAGLIMLNDASQKSVEQVFHDNKSELNRNMVLAVDPKVAHNRDIAIAHRSAVIYGTENYSKDVLAWLHPLSPVLGWNYGDEDAHTRLPSQYGHFNSASNWCMNLPLLSAGSEDASIKKIQTINLKNINFEEKGNYHSFVMSDGDNLQWLSGGFFFEPAYWANQYNVSIPMNWTACPSHLSMANPCAWNYLANTKGGNNSIIEYGGGYHYPDEFASKLGNREFVQRQFAKRINAHMKQMGVKVFGFICINTRSEESKKAYQIFAEEIEDLTGMFAVQYSPYEDGKGEVFWAQNKTGVHIPIVCPKYAIWASLSWSSSGNPDEIAKQINKDASQSDHLLTSTIIHAWSSFEKNEAGKTLDATANSTSSERGVTPVQWAVERLNKEIKVVSYEELLWRIRMENYPEEVKVIIKNMDN